MVLRDILPDREGVLYVTCLSSGMDYCVRVVVATDSAKPRNTGDRRRNAMDLSNASFKNKSQLLVVLYQ